MAHHGRALGAACPVAAGAIFAGRERAALRGGAGQHVVTIRREAHARNELAALAQRVVKAQFIVVAVQIVKTGRDDLAFEILPRAVADAVACIDRRLPGSLLGTQIGAPSFPSGAETLRQRLAMLVGAFDAAQIGALAEPGAGDEERHTGRLRQWWWRRRRLLCIDSRRYAQCQRRCPLWAKADIRIAQSHVRFTPKWAREAPRSCKKFARRQNSRHDPLDPGFGGFCPPPMLEDDMATFTRSQSLLVSAGAGALSGAALLTVLGGNIFTVADAGATAIDLSPSDFPICHTPAAIGLPSIVLRLAQTEVPRAEMSAAKSAPAFADTEPPLWPGLGAVTYEITTTNERAQAYFDQGLRLAYAFNHGEAQRAFRMAQKLDPGCAMCFWGEALVLGPNINLPMQEDAMAPAYAAAQKTKALAGKASTREQALIGALTTRYGSNPKAARPAFDKAYASAMAKVAAQYPDDNEIATLYAEAVMDISPWDYWKPGGRKPNPQSVPIVPTLERVLARNPGHPGAIHLYIHAVEASDRPKRAEPY